MFFLNLSTLPWFYKNLYTNSETKMIPKAPKGMHGDESHGYQVYINVKYLRTFCACTMNLFSFGRNNLKSNL